MSLANLETTLADVETELWKRRSVTLESLLDAISDDDDPDDEVEEQSQVASDALSTRYKSSAGGLGKGAPEGYRGRSVEREGDIKFDDGSVDSAQAERMNVLKAAMRGGPADMPPQTTTAKAAAAKKYSRKDRDNMGDVDNSGAMSGAGASSQHGY